MKGIPTMVVTCETPDCENQDVAIDVPEPEDDTEAWQVTCGVCGAVLHDQPAKVT
jgi:ribosomal protein S27E